MASLDVDDVRDALSTTVLPKIAEVSTSIADAASNVDTHQLKRWWPLAAAIGLFVAIGFLHRRQLDKANDSQES